MQDRVRVCIKEKMVTAHFKCHQEKTQPEHCFEVAEKLGLSELRGRQWFVQPTSATKGSNTVIIVIGDIYYSSVSARCWHLGGLGLAVQSHGIPLRIHRICKFCSFRTAFAQLLCLSEQSQAMDNGCYRTPVLASIWLAGVCSPATSRRHWRQAASQHPILVRSARPTCGSFVQMDGRQPNAEKGATPQIHCLSKVGLTERKLSSFSVCAHGIDNDDFRRHFRQNSDERFPGKALGIFGILTRASG